MISNMHRIHDTWRAPRGRHPHRRRLPTTVERLEDRVLLAAGDLDSTFDGDGRVTLDVGGGIVQVNDMDIQQDGKIVVVGSRSSASPSDSDFLIARFNRDGSLDDGSASDQTPGNRFGTSGWMVTDFGSGAARARSVAIQPDGKIVVAGDVPNGANSDFGLVRYNIDGSIDDGTSSDSTPGDRFGASGRVVTDFGVGFDSASAVAIQPDDKILVAGSAQVDASFHLAMALARYNSDGSPDDGSTGDATPADQFGAAGKVTTGFGGDYSAASALALMSSGAIAAAGFTTLGTNNGVVLFALAVFDAHGDLRSAFDGDGRVTADFGGGNNSATAVVVQADQKIVAVGSAIVTRQGQDFAIIRYNPDGSIDDGTASDSTPGDSFGTSGRVTTDRHSNDDLARDAKLQPDGKLVVAGSARFANAESDFSSNEFFVVRYLPDGSIDPEFGDGGVTTSFGTVFPDQDQASAVAFQRDGNIVAAGTSANDLALARYLNDATPPLPPNMPPIPDAGGPYAIDEGSSLALDASRSFDPDSDPISFAWNLNGDGLFQDATGAKPELSPSELAALGLNDGPQGLLIRARISDDHGNTVDSPLVELQIRNVAPAVFLGANATIDLADEFLRTGSFTDPGADQWTGSVDYGDGDGPIPLSLDGTFIGLQHRYQMPGRFTVSVSISDDDGATGTYGLEVTVRGPTGASIRGQKFDDIDGSGTHDIGESGLNGWTIELVDPATGTVVATQVTHDVDLNRDGQIDPQTERGLYAFEAVPPGNYVVREVSQVGWHQTLPGGETERVSLAQSGLEPDFGSFTPSISADGRIVAFASDADNLVPADTNSQTDIFVVDRETGNVDRVSVSNTAEQANGSSFDPSISSDGQWIAFRSFASNLVAGDDNSTSDIFVYHRLTRSIRRVTLNIAGRGANDASFDPVISGDGRFVAFDSQASNLVPDDTNGARDIFVVDLHTRLIERVSVDGTGRQANEASHQPSLSDDGRFVAFASYASNLVPFDTNGEADVFVFDRSTRGIERVSVNDQRTQGNNASTDPSISGNGRFVAFSSIANNLVVADPNGQADIFVFDRTASTIELVSTSTGSEWELSGHHAPRDEPGLVSRSETATNGSSVRPSINRDGRFVAFVSYAENLFPADGNGQPDIFLFDRATAVTDLVSLDVEGGTPIHPSFKPAVSADGDAVAFGSFGTSLVTDDHNEVQDIFVRSRVGVYRVTLGTDEPVDGLDFGNQFRLAAIAGQKIQDTNRNGVRDSGEPGLDGWQVDLLSAATGAVVASQTTFSADLNGDGAIDPVTERGLYRFDAIPADHYEVREVLEPGWRESAPQPAQLSFAAPTRLDVGAKEFGVTMADFNRDGVLDLAVASRNSDDVSILINAGDGTFRPAVRYSIGLAHQPQAIQAADLEGDGDVDLVVASFNTDFASDRASVLVNRGDGTFFPASTLSVGFGSQGLAVADFNGDRLLDIAVANTGSNNVAVLLNRPTIGFPFRGTRYTTQTGPTSVVAGDFDGDGDVDLAVSNHGSSSVSLLRGLGNGFFQPPENFFAGEDVTGLAAGDLDGDRDLDLAVANPNMRTVAILKNRGDGTFNPPDLLTDENHPFGVTAADLDGDGDLDLAASTRSTPSASVFRNNGNGTFQAVQHLAAGDDGFSIAAGDLDRDGDLDLVVANGASDDITILRNLTHSHMVTVERGERAEQRDFLNFQLGTIRGRVFIDTNSSGTREVAEAGLAGWVVFLDSNGNGVADTREPSTISDSSGDYAFRNLPDGTYTVREVRPSGWIGTTPVSRSYSVTISASTPAAERDFGNVLPRVSFSTGLFRVDERSGIAQITAQLNAAAEMPVTVTYATANGTATTRDYQPARGSLTFAPGQVQQAFTVPIRNDRRPEGIETVGLELIHADGAVLGNRTGAQLLIVDGEDLPTVQFQARSLQVRETARSATIVVTLSADMRQPVRVNYKAADLSARDSQDYLARNGTLTFAPHETRKTFTIPILDDRIDEPNQEFELTLSSPVGAIVGTSRLIVRIQDDDAPPTIGFSPPVVVVNEEDVAAIAYVELSGETEWPVSVTATTEGGGTATSGRDYRALTSTLLFGPGERRKPLIVEVFQDAADSAPEPTETIELRLSGSSNATLTTRFSTIFILDVNDATARAQRQMEQAQSAFRSRDSAAYRSTVQGLLDESRTLNSNDLLARVEDLTLAGSHAGFEGLAPLVATYVHELSLRDDDVNALRRQGAFAALSDSLQLFNDGLSVANQQDCIEFLESLGSSREIPPPFGFEGPIGCFNDAPPEDIDSVDLVNGLILDPVYVNGYLLLVMDPHRAIRTGLTGSGWSAEIIGGPSQLPEGGLVFFSDSNRLVIQGYLANTARSRTFTIRLTNGTLIEDFQVTLRVPLGVGFQGIPNVDFEAEPGDTFSLPLFASGGPTSCVGIASPAIPCGPMTWNLLPAPNSQVPAWLSLDPQLDANGSPTDNIAVHGTVPDDAFSFSVFVQLQQASASTGLTLNFRVPVSISASDRSGVEGLRRLDRGDAFSLQLPTAHGGDGSNYTWQLGFISQLPDGIQLVERNGHVFVEGTVAETAELGPNHVVLRLHSTSGDDAVVSMDFDIGRRFRVLTQNTMLRPDDIITAADFALISAGLASPFTALAAATLLVIASYEEASYDAEVQNTDDDNIERLDFIADRFGDYDIVALQEVFDPDRREQLADRALADFHLFDGPGTSPFIVDFSDVELHIPQGASGVSLLVRHGLSGSDAQTELAQMQPYHHSEMYASSADADSHANKGFVFEKVQLGSDPNDFIYVVDTHPQADYTSSGQHASVRATQLAQIRDYVNAHTDPAHPVLFMGDFNIREIDDSNGNGVFDGTSVDAVVPEYLSMLSTLGGNSAADDLAREYWDQHDPTFLGATNDSHRNAYAYYWFNGANNPFRERLDYVLVRQGTDYRLSATSLGMVDTPLTTRQCHYEHWIDNPPGIQCSVSDHFGLEAELRLERV
jgi:uncharacterized delta-60 repeat protein